MGLKLRVIDKRNRSVLRRGINSTERPHVGEAPGSLAGNVHKELALIQQSEVCEVDDGIRGKPDGPFDFACVKQFSIRRNPDDARDVARKIRDVAEYDTKLVNLLDQGEE